MLGELKIQQDSSSRPYSTIEVLKAQRDLLAHPRPDYSTIKGEVIADDSPEDAKNLFPHLYGPWRPYTDDVFYRQAYEDVEMFWAQLMTASGLRPWDAMTRSADSTQFVGYVEE